MIQLKVKKNQNISVLNNTDNKQKNKFEKLKKSGVFTKKEIEILQYVSTGLINREISDKLSKSEHTIKKHLYNMFQKLKVNTRMALVLKAKELGLLD